MALADVVSEQTSPASEIWGSEGAEKRLNAKIDDLVKRADADLRKQGLGDETELVFEKFLFMRYDGSDAQLVIKEPEDKGLLADSPNSRR